MERPEIPLNTVGTISHIVQNNDLASALSSGEDRYPDVFATSRMIALMEVAASRVLRGLLREGELSVGAKVNVSHTAATPPGSTVHAEARYLGQEGKLYTFEVIARDEAGEIGRGTHHRAIIQTSRLIDSARRRIAARTVT